MSISSEWSRDLAINIGERGGRTVSGVLGDGLALLFGIQNDGTATDIVHGIVIRGLAKGLSSEVAWSRVIGSGAVGFLVLWGLGQSVKSSGNFGHTNYSRRRRIGSVSRLQKLY